MLALSSVLLFGGCINPNDEPFVPVNNNYKEEYFNEFFPDYNIELLEEDFYLGGMDRESRSPTYYIKLDACYKAYYYDENSSPTSMFLTVCWLEDRPIIYGSPDGLMTETQLLNTITPKNRQVVEKQSLANQWGLDEDHVFIRISLARVDEVVSQSDTTFIYFASPICPACVNMTPRINQHAKDAGVSIVYYVEFRYDSTTAREWSEQGKYDYRGTPLFVKFVNGQFERSNFTDLESGADYERNIIDMLKG